MRSLCLAVVLAALGGCASHKELKAPCPTTASLDRVGCGDRLPVNVAFAAPPLAETR